MAMPWRQLAGSTDTGTDRRSAGLRALCFVAAQHGVSANEQALEHQLWMPGRDLDGMSIVRLAGRIGLKAKRFTDVPLDRLADAPKPLILATGASGWIVLGHQVSPGRFNVLDPESMTFMQIDLAEIGRQMDGEIILLVRDPEAGRAPARHAFAWLTAIFTRYRSVLAHVMLASFCIQLFALVSPLMFQLVVDKVLVHNSHATLVTLAIGLLVICVFDIGMKYLRTYAMAHTSRRIEVEIGSKLCRHLFSLPISYFEARPAGLTAARIREIETIQNFLTGQAPLAVIDGIFLFAFVGVLFLYSVPLTLIVLASFPLYLIIAALARPIVLDLVKARIERWTASQQFIVESVIGARTVKAAAIEPLVSRQWDDRLAAYVRASFSATMGGAMAQTAIEFVVKLTGVAILYFGAQQVIGGAMTVGGLIAFNMIATQTSQPILRISQLWQDYQQVRVSVDLLGDIMNAEPEQRTSHPVALPPMRGAIELRDVSFRYRPDMPWALRRVSLDIRPGESIGIVGASGSGKSTLAKLLQRVVVPESGTVLVDGVDIGTVDLAWLRRQIGVVLQESELFNRSIHDNIALARPGMSREQVTFVARLAGADEFIQRLPLGYDTVLEERGANLSGGQRQRLSIARALAIDPRIVIFDEATSALDYESEHLIQANMRQISENRTVIVIAHRLAAVRQCHWIVCLDQGEIVEVGTHDALLERQGGVYARLWALQSGVLS